MLVEAELLLKIIVPAFTVLVNVVPPELTIDISQSARFRPTVFPDPTAPVTLIIPDVPASKYNLPYCGVPE